MFKQAARAAGLVIVGVVTCAAAPAPPPSALATIEPSPAVDGTEDGMRIDASADRVARMTVPVRLNGAGPYGFVVDTGATATVVSDKVAAALALPSGPTRPLHSATGTVEVPIATIASMEVGGLSRAGVGAAVIGEGGLGAEGMLGIDSLADRRVVINFRTSSMSVGPARGPQAAREADPPGTIVVLARRKAGQLILTEARYRGQRIDVVIDTGAAYSIGNAALMRLVMAKEVQPVGSTVTSVTGQTAPVEMAVIPELSVGTIVLGNVPAAFGDLECFRRFGLGKRPALLLGMNALRLFERVAIDFGRRQVSFFSTDPALHKPVCRIGSRICTPV